MLNSVTIHGRMVRDPDLRTTQSGKSVCAFCVANDTGYGERKTAHFLDCVAWEKTAELLCSYFAKGQEVLLRGQLQTREYEDREGKKRKATEIVVREVDFCGPGPGKRQEEQENYEIDDDLPF